MSMKTILVPMENHDAMQSALETALPAPGARILTAFICFYGWPAVCKRFERGFNLVFPELLE